MNDLKRTGRHAVLNRNIVVRGSGYYFKGRNARGKIVRVALVPPGENRATQNLVVARCLRDEMESARQEANVLVRSSALFSTVAEDYLRHKAPKVLKLGSLKERTDHLSLASVGGILEHFGDLFLDEVDRRVIGQWRRKYISDRGLTEATGDRYLCSIEAVLRWARDDESEFEYEGDPVGASRRARPRDQGIAARQQAPAKADAQPVEDPAELAALTRNAKQADPVAWAIYLCGLDAGLRLAEVRGLRWSRVLWGQDENDLERMLVIDASKPNRSSVLQSTKSGEERWVPLSRRLRRALEAIVPPGALGSDDDVFPGLHPDRFRKGAWKQIVRGVELPLWTRGALQSKKANRAAHGIQFKDLRSTFATQLRQAKVDPEDIQLMIGHSDVNTTKRHYIKGREMFSMKTYEPPMVLLEGEVPPDFIVRRERGPVRGPDTEQRQSESPLQAA